MPRATEVQRLEDPLCEDPLCQGKKQSKESRTPNRNIRKESRTPNKRQLPLYGNRDL